MTRKGGGRESGSGDEVAPVATESGYAPAHTAANPAAHRFGKDWVKDTNEWQRRVKERDERVRALEAELAATRATMGPPPEQWREMEARAERAEAHVKELEDEIRIFRQNAPALRAELRGEDRG